MNKYTWPKIINLLLLMAFIGPILYGLYLYDWDLNKFLGISELEFNVKIENNVEDVSVIEDTVRFTIVVRNIGDAPINISRAEANVNITMDKQFVLHGTDELVFDKFVYLKPGEEVKLTFQFKFDVYGVIYQFQDGEYVLELTIYSKVFSEEFTFSQTFEDTIKFGG